ncbi:nuclear transport factor 2 family protein [Flavobacteriaceae bacterium KMM 6897]|nr:nuclear transport factor 2 family protein [Flavobacteriaceae bacterium KMM 6897]MEB8344572.1 nuclear transport factor 2 family protein [Flavobacteriaceae bacterium KMM 6898]
MKEQIEQFYSAFSNLDAEKMVAQYHEDVIFEDPAFGVLKGAKAKNMWRMLCASQKGKEFKVNVSNIESFENEATATWEAFYVFSKTGRNIHNTIQAKFKFRDGKIIFHKDTFDLYKWSIQAMGIKGLLLGWTTFFKKKLHLQTNKLLSSYESKL